MSKGRPLQRQREQAHYAHFIPRLKQRYGIDFTDCDCDNLGRAILAGKNGTLVRKHGEREILDVEIFGQLVRIVWDLYLRCVVTALPA